MLTYKRRVLRAPTAPLEAAKRGKILVCGLRLKVLKKKASDIVISAGNTGALLVIAQN